MLNVPNLPTDNLYKFAALAGVVACLTGVYLPSAEIDKLASQFDALSIEVSDTEAKRALLGEDGGRIDPILVARLVHRNT